ncbi:MAG: hypothetical protein U0V70_18245 [Terriglobia bacterium]
MNCMQDSPSSAPNKFARWLFPSMKDILFLSYLFAPLMGNSSACLGDSDTGWHIQNGEHILQTFSLPRTDYFSYTARGKPWFAWEWLSDVVMALIYRLAGINGIVVWANITFAVTFTLLFIWILRRGGNIFVAVMLSILAGFAASIHWLARPHLFTMLFLLVAYILLEQYEATNNPKPLYGLPLLVLVWTNLHAGFIVGLIVLLIYALGNLLRSLTCADDGERTKARLHAKVLATVFLICLAASFVNPYGVKVHAHIIESYVSSNHLMDNITEFRSPSFHVAVVKFFELLILVATVVASISIRRFGFIEIGLLVFWTHMALISARHIPLYSIIVVPIVALHLTDYLQTLESGKNLQAWIQKTTKGFRRYSSNIARFENQFKGVVYPLLATMALILIAVNQGKLLGTQVLNKNFDSEKFPVAAAAYLDAHELQGNFFTTDQWGGYLIYRFYPKYPVFFDGRSDMYGEELMKDYFKLVNLEYDWKSVVDKFNIRWMLLPFDVPLPAALKDLPEWRVVYDDHQAIIFIRDTK